MACVLLHTVTSTDTEVRVEDEETRRGGCDQCGGGREREASVRGGLVVVTALRGLRGFPTPLPHLEDDCFLISLLAYL